VKNNLAGIIGLLSIGEAELPERSRRWLDRAIERIEMMARAHELFAGGVEQVSLAELVAQMLPSLSVVKPPEVNIQTNLGGVDVRLRTDRAVSLVMVLHELCYNAIVHGVGSNGSLRIGAEIHDGQELVIEVENDEGCERAGTRSIVAAVVERPQTGSGLGLKLVDGLVRRELHGQFTLTPRSEGGTMTTVRFPLLPDELRELG
jgi:two-component sensor histidine kinase